MTRGCGILAAAAFATAGTWPSSTPGRSSRGSAWGFIVPSPPAAALRAGSGTRAGRSWRGPRAAAASERRPSDGRGRVKSWRALCASAAFSSDNANARNANARASSASGEGWGAGRARAEGAGSCRSCGAHGCNSRTGRAALALAAASAAGSGGDSGDGGPGGLGLDPESVARAREAAKNDDYEWFMEFIGGDEEDGDSSSSSSSSSSDGTAGARSTLDNNYSSGGEGSGSRSSLSRRRAAPPSTARRRAPNNNNGGGSSSSRETPGSMDPSVAAGRRRSPPTGRGFQAPPNGADGRWKGSGPGRAPADSAYDYDLDDEFDQEPGRGGWDYDPGLSKGIGARRRGVVVDKVRARTKPASMRMPLEEDLAAVVEGAGEEGAGEDQQPDLAAAATDFEPVDSEKAAVLTGDLGYTGPEVNCMDPDMADLAIERRIRRPASGMPSDWVAVGVPPPPPPPPPAAAAPGTSASSQTYFGDGVAASASSSGKKGEGGGGGGGGGVDGGALDLEAILGDGYDYEQTGGGGSGGGGGGGGGDMRQEGPRRTRPRPNPEEEDREGGRPPRRDQRQQQQRNMRRRGSPYYYDDDEYGDGDDRRGGLRGGRVSGRGGAYGDYDYDDFYYDDDRAPSRAGRGGLYEDGYAGDGSGGGGGGRRRRGRRPAPRRKEPEISGAERYEREIFGGLNGADGGGGAPRRREEEEKRDQIWTGVGPDGPWPTLEEFTKLLREETEVRLSLVGPWAAEVVSVENRFRLQAYEKWLEILDKGIGETLEEAGVFDAAFTTDDDFDDGYADDDYDGRGGNSSRRRRPRSESSDTNNLYDSYTNYGYAGDSGGGGGGYDPQGTRDERGLDYDDRLDGDDGDHRQGARRNGEWDEDRRPSRRKFDVGSFLRDGAQSIMQPAAGMEAKAAEFERRYPGRTRSNALEYGEDGDEDGGATGRDRFSADDIGNRPPQPQQQPPRGRQRGRREGGDVGVEYRESRRYNPPAGGYYQDDEDEYEY